MIGGRRDHRRLLAGVRSVIVDELHAFAADDRGWHLLALLQRLRALGAPVTQCIGLSATVGDPATLLEWLAGKSGTKATVVQVPAAAVQPELTVDFVGTIANAAKLISQLHIGEKRLVFCDSRSKVEALAVALRELGVEVFVSHAALSADTRRQAEQAFAERQNCVIVATSTLELGLDVGDLDRVIQIDAPASVASFLQRLGRTGRRDGSLRNTLFIATSDEGLLEALAITTLSQRGYVEPVCPPPLPCHVVVQQLFATLAEHGREFPESDFLALLAPVPGFSDVLDTAWARIRDHLLEQGYLTKLGLMLCFGPRADRKFQGKGLADLCVSFDSPRTFTVLHGTSLVGSIDPLSLNGADDGSRVLALGGRSWRVVAVDHARGRLQVVPAEERGSSRWTGAERGESRAVARTIRLLLADDTVDTGATLSRRAAIRIAALRERLEGTLRRWPVRTAVGGYVWWTYEGMAANRLLAGQIAAAQGRHVSAGSWDVSFSLDDTDLERAGGWGGLTNLKPIWEPDVIPKFAKLLPDDVIHWMTLARAEAKASVSSVTEQLRKTAPPPSTPAA